MYNALLKVNPNTAPDTTYELVMACNGTRFTGTVGMTPPECITAIGDYAFSACSDLGSITIHDKITSIGEGAFSGCNVTNITFPVEVPSNFEIKKNTFQNCTGLKDIVLPSGTTSIGDNAFQSCADLVSITIPDGVTSIAQNAFVGCDKMEKVNFGGTDENGFRNNNDDATTWLFGTNSTVTKPSAAAEYNNNCEMVKKNDDYEYRIAGGVSIVRYIGTDPDPDLTSKIDGKDVVAIEKNAFRNNNTVTSIKLPSTLQTIGAFAFASCNNLSTIEFSLSADPDTSKLSIGERAFESCSNLENVTIPQGVEIIGSRAFADCSKLKTIEIPDSVTSIAVDVVKDCNSLKDIYYHGTKAQWDAYNISGLTCTIHYDYQSTSDSNVAEDYQYVVNTDGTVTIERYVKTPISNNKIAIPNYIKGKPVTVIGKGAFYLSKDASLLDGNNTISVIIPSSVTEIQENAFLNCKALKEITIPSTVEKLGNCAFANSGLKNLIIKGDSLENDGVADDVFKETDLANVTIPASKMDTFANKLPSSLKTVTITDSNSNVDTIPANMFNGCTKLTTITLPETITTIDENAFFGCKALTEIKVPETITTIGKNAFSGCTALTKFTIGDKVTTIGESAFASSGLTEIVIPSTVTKIDPNVFAKCANLTKATINRTEVSKGAFSECSQLTNVTIEEGVTTIEENAFAQSGLTGITIPKTVTTIGKGAFAQSGLEEIEIPTTVTTVGEEAFYNCNSLKEVTIKGTMNIGNKAFSVCNSLKKVTLGQKTTSQGVLSDTAFKDNIELDDIYYEGKDDNDWKVNWANLKKEINHDCTIHYIQYAPDALYQYQILDDGTVKITGYKQQESTELQIPKEIKGCKVTALGKSLLDIFKDDPTQKITVIVPPCVTAIEDPLFTGYPNLTICCDEGSYAGLYCKKKNLSCEPLPVYTADGKKVELVV